MPRPSPHRILLVREWDSQVGSSGCCGRLGGLTNELGDPATYAHTRAGMEAMGAVYRALRAELPGVELSVVDPRNTVWLVPTIWRDARRRGMSRNEAWSQVRRGTSTTAVLVDGRVLFAGRVPTPDEAVTAVLGELAKG